MWKCISFAEQIVYADFDDTIVETRASYNGIFNSKIILFRIDKINPIQKTPTGPEEVEVTQQEMRKIREGLAKYFNGKFIPGSLKTITLSSGQKITIGDYALIPEKSFKYMRAATEVNRNYLLEDFQRAEKLSYESTFRGEVLHFKGPFWDLMIHMLNDKTTAKNFGIVTARGHTEKEWGEFFSYLKERGYIKFLPNLKNIHNISNPEYLTFGETVGQKKANLIAHLLIQGLGRTVLTDKDLRVDRDGKGIERSHLFVFADDSQENLREVQEVLEKISTGRYHLNKIKMVVVNTGSAKDVQESKKPRIYVIQGDGTTRKLTNIEMQEELTFISDLNFSNKVKSRSLSLTCQGLFL